MLHLRVTIHASVKPSELWKRSERRGCCCCLEMTDWQTAPSVLKNQCLHPSWRGDTFELFFSSASPLHHLVSRWVSVVLITQQFIKYKSGLSLRAWANYRGRFRKLSVSSHTQRERREELQDGVFLGHIQNGQRRETNKICLHFF